MKPAATLSAIVRLVITGLEGSSGSMFIGSSGKPMICRPCPTLPVISRLETVASPTSQRPEAFVSRGSKRAGSQASPTPLGGMSVSSWPGFATVGQLSPPSAMPSPSMSPVQSGPWPGFGTSGQLSSASSMPSPSSSSSQASPIKSPSASACTGFGTP